VGTRGSEFLLGWGHWMNSALTLELANKDGGMIVHM
jgi:hypothetical protein